MTRWEVDGFQCAIHAVAPRGGHSDCPGFPDGDESDGCVFCYTYYREAQVDPWIVAEVAGTRLCAVIARWDAE